jgi:hypothetical protein
MPSHYPYLLDPKIYPDYTRRPMRVPDWAVFDNVMQFTTLRWFKQEEGRLIDWREDLDLYTEEMKLGRVIWPAQPTLHTQNVKDLIGEIKRRGLYFFDLWGYVPNSPVPGAVFAYRMPPAGMVAYLEQELGDRFLGIDNGEQDGRYIGRYACQQCPGAADRVAQYLNFQRYFQRLGDDLGNHLTALVSICFGHYLLKDANHILLGAETAQMLPSSQVFYAFIRGAGKQYGVHWFGNASVWNRWGWKTHGGYDQQEDSQEGSTGHSYGPEKGTSLNLLKRLLYTHYLYNSVAAGFELSWLRRKGGSAAGSSGQPPKAEEWELSPVGVIQQKAAEFVAEQGHPGVMHTPVALLLDFYAGWAMPRRHRHLLWHVWGNMPYGPGDYLTHGVISLLYPGYEDSGYYHNERGFLSPTPFGDMADCVLSDIPLWVLRQYGLVVAAGELRADRELEDKLRAYVAQGGHLVVTAGNARRLVPGLDLGDEPVRIAAGSRARWSDGTEQVEAQAFDLYEAKLPQGAQVEATVAGRPAVVRIPAGAGAYSVSLTPFGLDAEPLVSGPLASQVDYPRCLADLDRVLQQSGPLVSQQVDHPLPCPYALLAHVRKLLEKALASQQLFSVSEGLGLITCRKGPGEYTLGIYNNDLHPRQMEINSCCGPIRSLRELALNQGEKGQVGYWPEGFTDNDGGVSDDETIAGGDIRLFAVKVEEQGVTELPKAQAPARPRGRLLALRGLESIEDAILVRPTFFQHFDGVKVDWTYVQARDAEQLDREQTWLARQRVRVVVDFTSGLNSFPDLTLLDMVKERYDESVSTIVGVLEKMTRLGAAEAVISLNCQPEGATAGNDRFLSGVRDICQRAAARGITLYLQSHPHRWQPRAQQTLDFIREVGASNLRLALNTGHLALAGDTLEEALAQAGDLLGMVLLSAPAWDIFDHGYDAHFPLQGSGLDLSALRAHPGLTHVLDACCRNQDEEYLDCLVVDMNNPG